MFLGRGDTEKIGGNSVVVQPRMTLEMNAKQ